MDNAPAPITLASLHRKASNGQELTSAEVFWLIDAVHDLTSELVAHEMPS